jgi:CheY-like chemotaxis protein
MALVTSRGFGRPAAHAALVVEDDPVMAGMLCNQVASLGHEWIHATTLEDALQAVAAGGFCYVLLDMQIPSCDGAPPIVACGETVLRTIREKYPARNARGKHLVAIIVVTSYSREPEFVTRLLKMDANDFVAKPITDQVVVPDKVREALAVAGREDHAACGVAPGQPAPASPSAVAAGGSPAGLVIDGETSGRRTGVLVHQERRELQNSKFVSLMRLVVARIDAPGSWLAMQTMGIGHAPETASRIGRELRGLLPKGERIVQTSDGRLRLNQKISVEVRWEALLNHPDAVVQKMARERCKKT